MTPSDVYYLYKAYEAATKNNWKLNFHAIPKIKYWINMWNRRIYKDKSAMLYTYLSEKTTCIETIYKYMAYAQFAKIGPYNNTKNEWEETYGKLDILAHYEKEMEIAFRILCLNAKIEEVPPKQIFRESKEISLVLDEHFYNEPINPHVLYGFNKLFHFRKYTTILTKDERKKIKDIDIIIDIWPKIFYNNYKIIDWEKITKNLRRIFNEIF